MMAGQKLSWMEFFVVFSRVWAKAATVENAQAGFRETGNKDILPETVFVTSKTAKILLPSTLPALTTRQQCLSHLHTKPQSLSPPPTGPRSCLLTLTQSVPQPSAQLSGHQPSHQPDFSRLMMRRFLKWVCWTKYRRKIMTSSISSRHRKKPSPRMRDLPPPQ